MNQPVIRTFSGKYVNPLDLNPEDIDIRDIAHGLALCNRFVGQTKKPMSVAQHSYFVYLLTKQNLDEFYKFKVFDADARRVYRQALLHDASEAYLGDMSKWVKHHESMVKFREFEDHAQSVISMVFNFQFEMHSLVKAADDTMVIFEGRHEAAGFGEAFLKDHPYYDKELKRLPVNGWRPWSWQYAEKKFLETYELLK